MLHKMSEIRGWTHQDMMQMDKPLFYRYYGYWYKDILNQEEYAEKEKQKNKQKQRSQNEPKNWKELP